MIYETGGGAGFSRLSYETLDEHRVSMYGRTLSWLTESQKDDLAQEKRQITVQEKLTEIDVIVCREEYPLHKSTIHVSFYVSSAQDAWEKFLADVCRSLHLEFIHSILERGDKAPVYRVLMLRNGAEYLVRQRETSSILQVLNDGVAPLEISWESTRDIITVKKDLAFNDRQHPGLVSRVLNLVSKPLTQHNEQALSRRILDATKPEDLVREVNCLYLPADMKPDSVEFRMSAMEVDYSDIARFENTLDIISMHRLVLEQLDRLTQNGMATFVVKNAFPYVFKVTRDLIHETDIVAVSLLLIKENGKRLTKQRDLALNSVLDTIQYHAPVAPSHRPRRPMRANAIQYQQDRLRFNPFTQPNKNTNTVMQKTYSGHKYDPNAGRNNFQKVANQHYNNANSHGNSGNRPVLTEYKLSTEQMQTVKMPAPANLFSLSRYGEFYANERDRSTHRQLTHNAMKWTTEVRFDETDLRPYTPRSEKRRLQRLADEERERQARDEEERRLAEERAKRALLAQHKVIVNARDRIDHAQARQALQTALERTAPAAATTVTSIILTSDTNANTNAGGNVFPSSAATTSAATGVRPRSSSSDRTRNVSSSLANQSNDGSNHLPSISSSSAPAAASSSASAAPSSTTSAPLPPLVAKKPRQQLPAWAMMSSSRDEAEEDEEDDEEDDEEEDEDEDGDQNSNSQPPGVKSGKRRKSSQQSISSSSADGVANAVAQRGGGGLKNLRMLSMDKKQMVVPSLKTLEEDKRKKQKQQKKTRFIIKSDHKTRSSADVNGQEEDGGGEGSGKELRWAGTKGIVGKRFDPMAAAAVAATAASKAGFGSSSSFTAPINSSTVSAPAPATNATTADTENAANKPAASPSASTALKEVSSPTVVPVATSAAGPSTASAVDAKKEAEPVGPADALKEENEEENEEEDKEDMEDPEDDENRSKEAHTASDPNANAQTSVANNTDTTAETQQMNQTNVSSTSWQPSIAVQIKRAQKRRFVKTPLPVVDIPIFRAFGGQMAANVILPQALGTLLSLLMVNYGNRVWAMDQGVVQEIAEVVLDCSALPRVLEYFVEIIECLYREGLGDAGARDEDEGPTAVKRGEGDEEHYEEVQEDPSMLLSTLDDETASSVAYSGASDTRSAAASSRLPKEDASLQSGQHPRRTTHNPQQHPPHPHTVDKRTKANHANDARSIHSPPPFSTLDAMSECTLPSIDADIIWDRDTKDIAQEAHDTVQNNSAIVYKGGNNPVDPLSFAKKTAATNPNDQANNTATAASNDEEENVEEGELKGIVIQRLGDRDSPRSLLALNQGEGGPAADDDNNKATTKRSTIIQPQPQQQRGGGGAALAPQSALLKSTMSPSPSGSPAQSLKKSLPQTNIGNSKDNVNTGRHNSAAASGYAVYAASQLRSFLNSHPHPSSHPNNPILQELGLELYDARYLRSPGDTCLTALSMCAAHEAIDEVQRERAGFWLGFWSDGSREERVARRKGRDLCGL